MGVDGWVDRDRLADVKGFASLVVYFRQSLLTVNIRLILLSVDKSNRGPTINSNATLLITPHFQHHLKSFLWLKY